MKISILLPYKENFSPNYAGAVSLFVKDMTRQSKYRNTISVFGNTSYKKKLLNNYINLNLNKKFYQSSSKLYVESFLYYEKKRRSDVIEVHNRPNYIKFLKDNSKSKIILYFHNDPLTMNGSKTIKERVDLLKNLDHIIFNSEWSKERFFIGLDKKDLGLDKISVVYQSAPRTKINFNNKKKIISFIGKLNSAKGYDLFGNAIIKTLDKYNDWKAIVIGDEPREKLFFKHKNLNVIGFKNNDYILNFLKKVSISVVCSRWNEPFGRTSLEAASRGAAVIISNRGGLPETTKNALVLDSLTVNSLCKSIEKLIQNKKLLLKLQKQNYLNFKYDHKFISNLIDKIRNNLIPSFVKKIFFLQPTQLKIIHITNFNERYDGRLHYNTGRRINNGFIRLGHNVLTISDRDIISKGKSIGDFKGHKILQKKILESFTNFNPDIVVLGHADAVSTETLKLLKLKKNNLKLTQWFLDPVSKFGPDFVKNKNRILDKHKYLDTTFLTSDPKSISFEVNNSFFMPNPCDRSFEILKNYENKCENDIFFAMSHGVHRGELKKGKIDDRESFINKLLNKGKDIKYDIYGMNNVQPIWGDEFIKKISNSYMGLNLSRGKPMKYYSSDRIAQLLGNGLLTFVDERTCFDDFIDKNYMVFYKNLEDLNYKIHKYKKDKFSRVKIAKNGKKYYLKYFNSTVIAEYILSKTLNFKPSNKFIWENK